MDNAKNLRSSVRKVQDFKTSRGYSLAVRELSASTRTAREDGGKAVSAMLPDGEPVTRLLEGIGSRHLNEIVAGSLNMNNPI